MTTPAPVTPPATMARVTSSKFSILVIVSLVLLAVQTIGVLTGRLIAVNLSFDSGVDPNGIVAALGVVGLLSLLVIGAAVVLAHLGLAQTRGDALRGRVLAGVALGAGYLHLLFWANRVILAIVAAVSTGDPTTFLGNVFWWA